MAMSKCGSCESTMFEMVENEPDKALYKMMFIQCAKCGVVVGVTEYFNIGKRLQKLAEKLGVSFN